MSIICITGPMAAGKNYICSQYEKQGWISIDADKTVHKAIEIATPAIKKAFSEDAKKANLELLNKDGSLNRRNLGALIFPNPELLAKQESIVYPIIIEETKKIISQNKGKNIILNATVLYKTPELLNLCEKIIFVTAPLAVRFIRARKRDKMPFCQIIQRFKSQKNLLKKYQETGIPVEILINIKKQKKI